MFDNHLLRSSGRNADDSRVEGKKSIFDSIKVDLSAGFGRHITVTDARAERLLLLVLIAAVLTAAMLVATVMLTRPEQFDVEERNAAFTNAAGEGCFEVRLSGEYIGITDDPSAVEIAWERLIYDAETQVEGYAGVEGSLTFSDTNEAAVDSVDKLTMLLSGYMQVQCNAVQLCIDGEPIGVLRSEYDWRVLLRTVAEPYLDDADASAGYGFEQELTFNNVVVDVDDLSDTAELTAVSNNQLMANISGDYADLDYSTRSLLASKLDVYTTETVVTEEGIAYDTAITYVDYLFKGEQEIVKAGVPGTKRVTRVYKCINGEPTEVLSTSETVLSEPVTAQLNEGTKPVSYSYRGTAEGAAVVAYAKQFIGAPYLMGAAGPYAYDCSGFTMTVYRHFGVEIPRTVEGQSVCGTRVLKSQLQVGDLVIFNNRANSVMGHVGIYVGGGYFIHCGTSTGVTITSLDSSYFGPRFLFGVHIE